MPARAAHAAVAAPAGPAPTTSRSVRVSAAGTVTGTFSQGVGRAPRPPIGLKARDVDIV